MDGQNTEAQNDALIKQAIREAVREALAEALAEELEAQLPAIQARLALGDDLPLDQATATKLLPFSRRTLLRLKKRRLIRFLRLPDVEKPFITVGALRALIRKSEPE